VLSTSSTIKTNLPPNNPISQTKTNMLSEFLKEKESRVRIQAIVATVKSSSDNFRLMIQLSSREPPISRSRFLIQ
jgi:hypothetical protein